MKKLKKILAAVVALVLLAGCGGTGNGGETPLGTSDSSGSTVISEKDKKIVLCFGDSITEGYRMEGEGKPYPVILQEKLGDEYKVYNAGVGGENMNAIMSRANAVDFSLGEDLVFEANAASARISAENGFVVTKTGEKIEYKGTGNKLPTKAVIINGQTYGFSISGGEYTITRTDTSEPLTIKKGTAVQYDYSSLFTECYAAVVLMGANDGYGTAAEKLINSYTEFGKHFERYIYITPFYYNDCTAEFDAAFGTKTLNIKACFRGSAFTDYGLEMDRLSEHYINKTNGIPGIFTYGGKPDEVHLSALGYKVLGGEVYKRGTELGYW